MAGGFVAGAFGRVDLPRVWEKAVEGDKSRVMNKVMAMRFKLCLLLLSWVQNRFVARLYQRPTRLLE